MVHGERHRRPAEDARRIRSRDQAYSDLLPSELAGEPQYDQGEEAEWRNSCIIGSFHHIGEQGGTELSQEWHQGSGSVVPRVTARTPALDFVDLRTVIDWIWLQTWTRVIVGVDV